MAGPAFFAFVFGALIGATMAFLHFTGRPAPKTLGYAHGLLVASGLVLLTVALLRTDEAGWGWGLLALFAAVASGGLYLFSRQARGERWPSAMVLIHGGLALLTIVLLGVWLFGGGQIDTMDVPRRSR